MSRALYPERPKGERDVKHETYKLIIGLRRRLEQSPSTQLIYSFFSMKYYATERREGVQYRREKKEYIRKKREVGIGGREEDQETNKEEIKERGKRSRKMSSNRIETKSQGQNEQQ